MSSLGIFSSIALRSLDVSNRIVISPMCQYSAKNGNVTEWHIAHYLQMALSGAGMIVIESTAISEDGRITVGDLGLYSDENEYNLNKLISVCKKYSSAKIVLQLSHAGRKGSVTFPWEGSLSLPKDIGWETYAPSPIPRTPDSNVPLELSLQQIDRIKDDFILSAIRANRCGVDIVEIHIAHGYLLHQFFSPISNKRTDSYGGCLDNRMRLILEIAEGIRKIWPVDKPLGARVTAQDWMDDGSTIDECVYLVEALKNIGIDYVCVSSGGILPITKLKSGPEFQVPFASEVKKRTGVITRAVGEINDHFAAQRVIESGDADLIAIGRGYLNDPRWVWRAANYYDEKIEVPHQYERGYW